MEISREMFDRQGHPRLGTTNPERMSVAFWEWMIRGNDAGKPRPYISGDDTPSGFSPYEVRTRLNLPYDCGPIWNFQRMGATRTDLPDGRTICIAGEHEDFYDPDFFIYNDVVVLHPDGKIDIYGYPKEIFPPTDFHSATLVDDRIFVLGRLGYQEERLTGPTPVHTLSLADNHIEKIQTRGDHPGWIFKHEAALDANGTITIRGGEILEASGDEEKIRRNFEDYSLDLSSGTWTRLTNRNWRQYSIHDGEGRSYFHGVRRNFDFLASINQQAAASMNSLIFISLDEIFDDITNQSGDDWDHFHAHVEGIPISLTLEGGTIEIVIESPLEEAHASSLASQIKARIEAHTSRNCILTST